jgi:CxxC motif-containing protein
MIKKMTCIECPQGCQLSIDIEGCHVSNVAGAKCPKGKAYAISEIEFPARIITSTIRTKGMDLKFVPVRTDKPIPKELIAKAMERINGIVLSKTVVAGSVVEVGFMGTDAKLISTRRARVI